MSFSRIFGAQPALPKAHIVSVEADLTKGLHSFSIVGLPDKAVEEARDRVGSAIKNTGLTSPKTVNKKIIISLSPAELKKEGAGFDLPVALAYLLAAGDISFDPEGKLFIGELTLDGSIKSVKGILSIILCARDLGFEEIFIPEENAREATLISGVKIFALPSLRHTIDHLTKKDHLIPPLARNLPLASDAVSTFAFDDIRGQSAAKRAIEIAAAGKHNIALYGPPGTGKTMLARAVTELLPDLSEEEMIEVTTIHSMVGNAQRAITRPPFRSPHHTSSYASLIGGGTFPRPGEATLAHRGVLFLDEFPEFHRDVINALREPLEDRTISVARARGSHVFPANFMLIAALNPCPCGFWGTNRCECMPHAVEKYRKKISGPIADRIDMWVQVGEMPPEALKKANKSISSDALRVRERISQARTVQECRFEKMPHVRVNADMKPKDIEIAANLSSEAEETLVDAAHRLKLSPRGYHRTIKLARTIADLARSLTIDPAHMLEALQYRARHL